MNILKWLRYKLWYYDFARFIKEQHLHYGAELGVMAGRSFTFFLKKNPSLQMVGIDLWEDQPDTPYSHNTRNEKKCRKRSRRFKERIKLFKGDAAKLAMKFPNRSFDFVFYDCFNYRISTPDIHFYILQPWLSKIKKGGFLISRDFHEPDIRHALNEMGFADIKIMCVNGKQSERVKYVEL